ncbi:MAG TPA: hypothetical protein VM238_22990 [Phycisphaerae bacterium]|nr:hypothetical protein [Phycisphaerae bacterium]
MEEAIRELLHIAGQTAKQAKRNESFPDRLLERIDRLGDRIDLEGLESPSPPPPSATTVAGAQPESPGRRPGRPERQPSTTERKQSTMNMEQAVREIIEILAPDPGDFRDWQHRMRQLRKHLEAQAFGDPKERKKPDKEILDYYMACFLRIAVGPRGTLEPAAAIVQTAEAYDMELSVVKGVIKRGLDLN